MEKSEKRRREDGGWLCWLARRFSEAWDWIDKRDIDKHVVTLAILGGTAIITAWAMEFSWYSSRPGLEIAAIIGAVAAPYMTLQAVAIKWYFEART